jgi:hypothetical protein
MHNGGSVKGGFGTAVSEWWTGGDLNPRPPECKSGVHAKLNYQPIGLAAVYVIKGKRRYFRFYGPK